LKVDLLCETVAGFVAVEVKAAKLWQKRYSRGLHRMREGLMSRPVRMFGIYLGDRPVRLDDVDVLPVADFLQRLWNGDILS
jgi:hypothetical protein